MSCESTFGMMGIGFQLVSAVRDIYIRCEMECNKFVSHSRRLPITVHGLPTTGDLRLAAGKRSEIPSPPSQPGGSWPKVMKREIRDYTHRLRGSSKCRPRVNPPLSTQSTRRPTSARTSKMEIKKIIPIHNPSTRDPRCCSSASEAISPVSPPPVGSPHLPRAESRLHQPYVYLSSACIPTQC
jgi:hypothetical protein